MFQMDKPSPLGKGYVQVYTGNGKGKSTAAFGLAFRATGRGLRIYVGQFIKAQKYGELEASRLVQSYLTIEQYGEGEFVVGRATTRGSSSPGRDWRGPRQRCSPANTRS